MLKLAVKTKLENQNGLPEETLRWFDGDELRARVFYEKYAVKELGEKTPEQMWQRVASSIASVEKDREKWAKEFYWLLSDFKFVPGGRILYGAGNPNRVTLMNCYFLPIKGDSIEDIFRTAREMARTYSYGGGVGIDITVLRPKGTPVSNSAITSTGAVSFMDLYSKVTGTIGQAGRRGALMITIEVRHPDVLDFIRIKDDPSRTHVRFANISVKVTDDFMEAVDEALKGNKNKEYTLWHEFETKIPKDSETKEKRINRIKEILKSNGYEFEFLDEKEYDEKYNLLRIKVMKKVKVLEIWNELVKHAWSSAEPGVIFWTRMKEMSNSDYDEKMVIQGTNPCGEVPLEPYGVCNLGSINLSKFVINAFTQDAKVDYQKLEKVVKLGVRFLDDVLDYNKDRHPLKEQSEHSLYSRRIGLGIMGLADMLIKLGIKYDSQEAIEFVDYLMHKIKVWAYEASIELAKEKGPFPGFNAEKYLQRGFAKNLPEEIKRKIKEHGIRNVTVLSIAPTGSISILAGCSNGIEPIFQLSYIRRSESLSKEIFKVYHPLVKEYMEIFGVNEESLPEFFVTAHEIKPEFRVLMQGTIQKHIDSSISSTVNFPEEATVEDIAKVYLLAWKYGCKGITVYREGSREGVMISEKELGKEKKKRDRSIILQGKTYKFKTELGNAYITVNADESSKPLEVFVEIGKTGSTVQSFAEALGRLVSLALRSGIDVHEVIRQLDNIKSGVPIRQDIGIVIYSVPDAIAKALKLFIGELEAQETKLSHFITLPTKHEQKEEKIEYGICPNCGNPTVLQAGCEVCYSCGFSKCS